MISAILFLIFNRPDTTALVMEAIRLARPPRLYVAADGPRDRASEAERCEKARQIATSVDWSCEVRTLFRGRNLGCRNAVGSAITWFFEHEEEGIILEDDCVPSLSFFSLCDESLERYRSDQRVMTITGDNFQDGMERYDASYFFSKFLQCWGWATWRRAWQYYDVDMALFPEFQRARVLRGMSSTSGFATYWQRIFESTYARKIDSWAYVWMFSCWAQNGLSATPRANLVSNIGFGAEATHTTDTRNRHSKLAAEDLQFPLKHPILVCPNEAFDDYVARNHFGISPAWRTETLGIPSRVRRKFAQFFDKG